MLTMTRTQIAEALFASDLEPVPAPTVQMIDSAVRATIARYGTDGCATRVAAEFGDHPELAIRRMIWVHRIMPAGA